MSLAAGGHCCYGERMTINAVLYSDQIIPANAKVDLRLVALMKGRGRRIGYIPSDPEPDQRFYKERRAYYARRDLDLDLFHDLDPTIACPDGDGIVVGDGIVDCIGEQLWVVHGTAKPISHQRFPLAGTPN